MTLVSKCLAVAIVWSAPLAASAGSFSYKAVTADLTLARAQAEGLVESCRDATLDATKVTRCYATESIWGGGIAGEDLYGTVLFFDEAGLAGFDLSFRRASLPVVEKAFVAKYGKPCRRATSALQNAFGATFKQEEQVFCFADGTMWLSRYDEEYLDNSAATFRSTRFLNRKAGMPKVNF